MSFCNTMNKKEFNREFPNIACFTSEYYFICANITFKVPYSGTASVITNNGLWLLTAGHMVMVEFPYKTIENCLEYAVGVQCKMNKNVNKYELMHDTMKELDARFEKSEFKKWRRLTIKDLTQEEKKLTSFHFYRGRNGKSN